MEVFPPFIAQCPENNGCSVHVARWQRRQHRVQERSIFTMWPCSGRGPSFCFSSHHSKEKFGSKYSPGPCSFDILCCDAVSGFNKSTKTSSWMQEFPSTQRGLAALGRHILLAWAAALRSLTKINGFGAQLSFRSRLAWPSHCSRGKDQHWFLSWKNVHHDTWVPGISSWSRREKETLMLITDLRISQSILWRKGGGSYN